MEIEYVTHAALLLRSARARLLTDPFFYPELDPLLAPGVRNFPPRAIDPAALGRLDYVFSSHEHHDHCHPETLARLAPQIGTVLLPAARPVLAARYAALGFRDVVLLENRAPRVLADGLRVTCLWDDPIDSMLLVEMDGTVVLHGNDCRPPIATFRELARMAQVDYAFLCSTSAQELYPLLLDKPIAELERLAGAREAAFFNDQAARIAALRPGVVVPYAYTASYVAADQLHLNSIGRLTPPRFRDRLATRLPGQTCWPLEPGDVIDVEARAVRPLRAESLWGRDVAGFRAQLAAYAAALGDELPAFDPGDADAVDAPLRRHLDERLLGGVPHAGFYRCLDDAVALSVPGRAGARRYVVDLRRRRVDAPPGERAPGVAITIPASLVASMLAGAYDPFMILYTYRIEIALAPRLATLGLSPAQEYALALGVFLTLFMDRASPVLDGFAGLERFLGLGGVTP